MGTMPWKTITLTSAATTYLSVLRESQWSRLQLTGAFAGIWLIQTFCWVVWAVMIYPHYFSPLIGLPEPDGNHWLLGQWKRIAAEPSGVPMMDWVSTIPHEGLIRYKGLFNQERLLVCSPKALAEVLVTRNYDFHKPAFFRWSIGRLLGIGIILAEGEEHKIQRKNLLPAFAFRHIKDLYPLFWEKSKEAVQAMTDRVLLEAAKEADDQEGEKATGSKDAAFIEAAEWASRATLDIIGVAGLGRDFGAIRNPDNHLSQTYQAVFRPSSQAQWLNLLGLFLPGWLVSRLPVKRNEDIAKSAKFIRATCADLIREKKEKLARKELTDTDILSVALESGGFTDENLADQLMTFLAAGHETTATAMTWAIYMLCLNPQVQTRLRKEIRASLPSIQASNADITSLDIDRMPYLNAVCNEVLRYYSPVPMTLRVTACDTTIQGVRVPQGTRIVTAPWATNRDVALWGADAARFDPERWLATSDDDKSKRRAASGGATSNYAFLTFLHGPRSCIGQGFAKAEFACLLSAWIGRFEFELKYPEEMDEKNISIKGGITARPANGLHVRAKILEGW